METGWTPCKVTGVGLSTVGTILSTIGVGLDATGVGAPVGGPLTLVGGTSDLAGVGADEAHEAGGASALRESDESMAQPGIESGQMVNCADNSRKRRRMRLMRICAVCFSTAALGLALVAGDPAVTACAVVTWFLTLFALGFGMWRDLKSNG